MEKIKYEIQYTYPGGLRTGWTRGKQNTDKSVLEAYTKYMLKEGEYKQIRIVKITTEVEIIVK